MAQNAPWAIAPMILAPNSAGKFVDMTVAALDNANTSIRIPRSGFLGIRPSMVADSNADTAAIQA